MDVGSRVPPNAEHAEKAIIGAAVLTRQARMDALNSLSPEDFYNPTNMTLFAGLAQLVARGSAVDAVILAAETGVDRQVINAAISEAPITANVRSYVAMVAETAALRRTIAWGSNLMAEAWAGRADAVNDALVNAHEVLSPSFAQVEPGIEASILTEDNTEPRWLIPNLLERQDRVIVTGQEGGGKSVLLRQVALMTAAGVNPFTNATFTPAKVLVLDLENSVSQIVPQVRSLISSLGRRYDNNCYIKSRPQGLDLASRRDQDWLRSIMQYHSPDLLCVGPLYKMYRGSERAGKASEEAADIVTSILDELRVQHDCAVWIEAHAPHGEGGDRASWRPRGSTLWLGWPEIGIGMKPIREEPGRVKLVRWRGDRVRGRSWPDVIKEGTMWPWEVHE